MKIYTLSAKTLFFSLLTIALLACNGISKKEIEQETFVAFQFETLRAHGEDTESDELTTPNTDAQHSEDRVSELRVVLFPSGVNAPIFNHKFTANELLNDRVVFKLKEMKHYDFYFIANESASNQTVAELAFLSSPSLTRAELEEFSNVKINDLVQANTQFTGKGNNIMMTACYKQVLLSKSLSGAGIQSDPYIIDFTSFNRVQRPLIKSSSRKAAEMMRSLAKLEITFKNIVWVIPTGRKMYCYKWALPYGFKDNSHLEVAILNIPQAYTLFPRNIHTDIAQVGKVQKYTFDFANAPDKANVVFTKTSENSIGGILAGDYKLTVYLPEYLAKPTLAETERPGINISYYTQDADTKFNRLFPIQNGGKNTHYEELLKGLTDRPDWNVYRNRLYKVTVDIPGRVYPASN